MNHRLYSDTEQNREQAARTEEEYVFRFPIDRKSSPDPINLREMLLVHLSELLDILTPTHHGREVNIDGFSLLNDRSAVHSLYPPGDSDTAEPGDPLNVYEPRIKYIQRIIESLLAVVDLEHRGQPLSVDAVRLKRLDQWLGPGGGPADVLAQAATRCNLDCRFCYISGSPPAFKPASRHPDDEYREILTRIDHYVPGSGLSLFPDMGSPCESLAHPRILDVLTALREKTGEPIRIPTNGSLLEPDMIEALVGMQPVFLDLSLNSASPTRRRWLMNDSRPQVAIGALRELKAVGIPYSVVIVPWPFPSVETMLADLKETVLFAARHYPSFVQISLPGYSRFFSEERLFDQEPVWNEIKGTVQELRGETDCPLILRPGLFEEYSEPEAVNVPYLIGTIRNSPLARAGVRMGDRILKVAGLPVKSRPQARSLLTTLNNSRQTDSSLTLLRNGERLDLELDPTDFDYPYDPLTAGWMGAVFASSGIPQEWIENLRLVISEHGAGEVLLLTSRLVRPVLEKMTREHLYNQTARLHFRVPENRYLGGNIFMGDLLVVEDFKTAVREFMAEVNVHPDLVLIPSSPFHLSGWGRDLTGRVYKEVERDLGIPVALLECHPIFD